MHSPGIGSHILIGLAALACAAVAGNSRDAGVHRHDAVKRLDFLGLAPTAQTLSRAILAGQPPIVDLLLAARADVNGTDAGSQPPLLAAAVSSNWTLVPRLIEAGADPNRADADGITPLMAACARGHLETVRALLQDGAKLASADRAGRTPLHYAIAGGQQPVAEYLMELPGAITAENAHDPALLALAVSAEDWGIVESILERHPGQGTWDTAARSALALALKEKSVGKARLVLSKFNGPPAPEGHRQPLLAYAAAVNDLDLGRLLLEAGADPDTVIDPPIDDEFMEHMKPNFMRHYASEEPGLSTLMIAAGLGRADFVRLLLKHGASRGLASRSKYRLVALYFACWADSPECQQALLADAPPASEVRVDIFLGSQNATLYKGGVPVFTTDISSGKSGYSTPPGRYVVTDKRKHHVSSIYKVKMPFFMRLSCKDFGLHEGYVSGGSPASHGCIRLPPKAAKKLFAEVPVGTLVTVSK